jgi:hypothetical protein
MSPFALGRGPRLKRTAIYNSRGELRRYHISYKTGLWAGISATSFLFTLQASERALPFQADEQVKGFQLFTVYFSRRAHSFTDREGVG